MRVLGVRAGRGRRERGGGRSNEGRGRDRLREREHELVRKLNAERRLFYTGARRYLMLWGKRRFWWTSIMSWSGGLTRCVVLGKGSGGA